MNTAQIFSFGKGPDAFGRPASWGGDRMLYARRIDGAPSRVKSSTKMMGEKFAPGEKLSPVFPSAEAAKAEFSRVISEESTGDLASTADCSKETVKCWRARRAFPGGEKVLELASPGGNPTVRRWVAIKLGFVDPDMMDGMMAAAARYRGRKSHV